jgi:serine phosphatase RsbU (regulator of sigma subunit)
MVAEQGRAAGLEWAVASRPLPGEVTSGDAAVIARAGNRTLVAAVDALGHGPEAGRAAAAAASVLREFAGEDVVWLVRRCHEMLRGTRGAAITAASLSPADGTMTWIAVGNVEGRLVHPNAEGRGAVEDVLLRGGAAGHELPPLTPVTLPVRRGDLVVFATDGVDASFADGRGLTGAPQQMAERILAEYANDRDDALVAVVRVLEANE